MLSINEIKQLVKLVDESSLTEFEYETEQGKIKMRKGGELVSPTVSAPVVQAVLPAPKVETEETPTPAAAPTEDFHVVTSPMVGTFYGSPNPESPAFVEPGSVVTVKSVVCIIEAMKLLNEVEADVNGEIVEVLVSNGELVEFGQPLFKVRKK
ncbi:acetyl-CoA carboxylase biotin carboxyl carrier family protein [Listeria weihenstephanensis FSL R9-0317]|uniref:Biotin carboxyl carrier protein of acetyl-CoA carboxylase n=1 Tax=Listeria weihenstephanensis TaxID=1006155 RepID=A0A1S7FUM4_9LIST|nr:acetyl-CoA carboxylase biotin carboxyl carrier protein [Listeria weihenstephanensis]AQY51092.1 acetyl-CoA carboxylase [Listeria weihenstephanensis]EUJ36513.1 acetyl-CoA carboxylase biotin carboxyl carrier family protein [Listeria weihenstephanensis FSL R9-0317]MBC1500082.1 acetyl-CoA carboxylase biotin carboxyl carrier protein [Listeria weihenstephanensis]